MRKLFKGVSIILATTFFSYSQTIEEIKIGAKVWMTKNLDVAKFSNGDPILQVKSMAELEKANSQNKPAWCYLNFDPSMGPKYGKLYNWYAVNDKRGLAPKGWYVASEYDWNSMFESLGGDSIALMKIKSSDGWFISVDILCDNCANWNEEYRIKSPCNICKDTRVKGQNRYSGGNGDNLSSLNGLPGGAFNDGYFAYDKGSWWTSSEYTLGYAAVGSTLAYDKEIYPQSAMINGGASYKGSFKSVRCIKDEDFFLGIKKIQIGSQLWMQGNLNVDKFRNGDLIPEAKTIEDWIKAGENNQPAWCYYDNETINGIKYGKLYNWHAVNDQRGLAPNGWHVPSDSEWTILTDYLGGEGGAGDKMKSISGWYIVNGKMKVPKGSGNNSSGFTGLPGGYRLINGSFINLGSFVYWWSSTGIDFSETWARNLNFKNSNLISERNYKNSGFYVRCVRD